MVGLEGVTAGLMILALTFGLGTVVMAYMSAREFGESVFGRSFKVFALGWAIVELHTAREIMYYLSSSQSFPSFTAAALASTGVSVVAASYYLVYREYS
ncbi:MAG: hypothetical protein ABEK01_04560 [Candidatus Nanohaloarchaea archaeon]